MLNKKAANQKPLHKRQTEGVKHAKNRTQITPLNSDQCYHTMELDAESATLVAIVCKATSLMIKDPLICLIG
jgi:hypothetical protein